MSITNTSPEVRRCIVSDQLSDPDNTFSNRLSIQASLLATCAEIIQKEHPDDMEVPVSITAFAIDLIGAEPKKSGASYYKEEVLTGCASKVVSGECSVFGIDIDDKGKIRLTDSEVK